MAKVKIEVEIPDGHEVTSLCRGKQYGEHADKSAAIPYIVHIRPATPFEICGKPADWPEWLKCDWVAKDANEKVWGYVGGQPHQKTAYWDSHGMSQMLSEFIAIEIPGPFEQSLRENPNRKK